MKARDATYQQITRKFPWRRWLLQAGLPLAIGAGIYALRPLKPWFWAVTGAGESWGVEVFVWLQALGTALPDWMLYNLPDALWLFACLSMIQGVWGFRWSCESLAWGAVLVMGAMGSEVLQGMGILAGTGDWGDVCMYVMAVASFFVVKARSVMSRKIIFDLI